MVPWARLELARIAPHAPQTCATTNYATSAIFKPGKNYLLAGAFALAAGAVLVAAFTSVWKEFVAGVSINALLLLSVAIFVFAGSVSCSSAGASAGLSADTSAPLRTETFPVNAGIESIRADSMNTIAATMVNFESTDAVPRGPKAALETLLVNKAPASVFPGCNNTAMISTMHARKNIVYKTYSNSDLPVIHNLFEAICFETRSANQRTVDIFLRH